MSSMYIRTKDGVYKIDEVKPYFLDEKQKLFINNELKVAINEQRVIDQSENLEELCDEFVVIENVYGKIYHSINYTLCDDLRNDKDNEGIYGCIWTSKGLIYVAKMNDKGELELI